MSVDRILALVIFVPIFIAIIILAWAASYIAVRNFIKHFW